MSDVNEIFFNNANSRDTYFTIHNVKEAQNVSKGKGVKVGIIDWLFAYDVNKHLYAGRVDISGESQCLYEIKGHGLMMATTLREIAPECEIYALNSTFYNNTGEVDRIGLFEQAINWAIENKMDVLTYSHAAFNGDHRVRANRAVEKAVQNGLITAFIHNDCLYNIWPYGCLGFGNDQGFKRTPDVNIYHFDYNTLFLHLYERYKKVIDAGDRIRSGNDLPYFSFSSMSVVLAGFISILKSINPSLTSKECKQLLIDTSYEVSQLGENWFDLNPCNHVVDIGKAASILTNNLTL